MQSNFAGKIVYDGRYSNGTVLRDGNYTFHLITWDRTSGTADRKVSFEVDNLMPSVSGVEYLPSNPLPRHDVNVSMIIVERNLRTVDLVYNYDDSGWITVACMHVTGNQWNASIPGNMTASRLKFYIRVEDHAGNILSDTAGGFYYGWENPVIPFVSPLWSSIDHFDDEPEFTTASELYFDFIFSEEISGYLARIFINYSTDGQTWLEIDLTRDGTRFNGSIGPFGNAGFETLRYEVFYEDIIGGIAPITSGDTIIAPVMPSVSLNVGESILLLCICIALGLMMGYGLSSAIFPDQLTPYEHYVKSFGITRKMEPGKKSGEIIEEKIGDRKRIEDDHGMKIPLLKDERLNYNPIKRGFVRSLRLQAISWIGSMTSAIILLIAGYGDLALIISVGAFLITVFLFFSALAYEIQQVGRRYSFLKTGTRHIIGYSFLLFLSLMSIFTV
nr:hypothetical protein [Candidatus Sigynarchaeota archaeon]